MGIGSVKIVIPAFEPDEKLLDLLSIIRRNQVEELDIILVDDGSGVDYSHIFTEATEKWNCYLVQHAENRGKGRAIKSAIDFVLERFPAALGIVTIDSDGQHTYEDTMKCLADFLVHPDSLVLGVRQFEENVPLRSKFGNLLTRDVLGAITGVAISDTQTGLRVIPMHWLPSLLDLDGERYEFEMNMLLKAQEDHMDIREVGIETIYIEENKSSHFHAIRDSIRVYSVFIKYIFSSVICFLIDIVAFTIVMMLLKSRSLESVAIASVTARAISSVTNYFFNHKLVFKKGTTASFVKYFLLVFVQISLSSLLVSWGLKLLVHLPSPLVKIIVDGGLFVLSYWVQKKLVFNGGRHDD